MDPFASWTFDGTIAQANVGRAVATAGDVNGDGYSDVIVGEPNYSGGQTLEGRVLVFMGGPSGTSMSSSFGYQPNQALTRCGWSVSTAGDVNGDGYDDVIVGGPEYDATGDEGRAWIFLGSATGLQGSPSWTVTGTSAGDKFGYCVTTAGDINDDGYDDVMVGAPYWGAGTDNRGHVYVYLGGASGPSASADQIFTGETSSSLVGWSLCAAGDVDGDRYDDVLFGAPGHDGGLADIGRVYCHRGTASGLAISSSWTLTGTQTTELLGENIGPAGDTNGDGYADILVGSEYYNDVNGDAGRVWLYYGGGSGLGTLHDTLTNTDFDDRFGSSVFTTGDVNGDGYADIAVGSQGNAAPESGEGTVHVYMGGPNGIALDDMLVLDSDVDFAAFGWAVQTAGDVNGDGFSDLLVGAIYCDVGELDSAGRAYVFHGHADGLIATPAFSTELHQIGAFLGNSVAYADVNADGYSDLVAGAWFNDAGETDEGRAYCWHGGRAGITSGADWIANGDQASAFFGRVVAGAGDVNGDGYEDVVATAPTFDAGSSNGGRAFVYHGSPAGLEDSPAWTADGAEADAWLGWSAASAGDLNGDGYGDLVVGVPRHDNPQVNEGAAYVYHGSPEGLTPFVIGVEGNQDDAQAGYSVAGAGDVNGDGYDDLISGAPSFDNGQTNEGVVFVFFGSPTGISASYQQLLERNQASAQFGISVAPAGDVNADGYSDVIIGASTWTNGNSQEGSVAVYLGSPAGLQSTPVFTFEGGEDDARLGEKVAFAGDINSDGYSDVAFAAPYYGPNDEGRVYIYRGTPTGLTPAPSWIRTGDDGNFGSGLAGGGDVDGNGFGDVAVGAPNHTSGQENEGAAFVFLGNQSSSGGTGLGLDRIVRMSNHDLSGPVALRGRCIATDRVMVMANVRTAAGRGVARIATQFSPQGSAWTGSAEPGLYWDTGAPLTGEGSMVPVREVVTGLDENTRYHWRARFESKDVYFPRTPWFSLAGNGHMEADVWTGQSALGVPGGDVAVSAIARIDEVMPTPMRTETRIRYWVANAGTVRLTVHDAAGRNLVTILDEAREAGNHEIAWDGTTRHGRRVAPGVYFARLEAAAVVARARVVVTP